jgi:hypothetical protein
VEDISYRGFGILPRYCEERFIPAAVCARFFVAEDEVVEEFARIGLLGV